MSDLRSIVSRIERIREEKKALTADERDIFTEAKSSGLDGKALRKVLQRRAMGDAAVAELDAIVDAYEAALGGKLVAAEALKAGASVRQAAKAAGVSVSTAQRTKNQVSEPDRAAVTSAPAGVGGKGVAQAMPPRPEPIPQSEAGASTRKDDDEAGGARSRVAGHKALSPASDTVVEQVRAARAWSPDPQPFDPNAKCDHAYVQGNGTGKFACVFCGEITFDRATLGPVPPRSDYESPAGAQLPPTRAADCDPAPDAPPHRAAGPAGETDMPAIPPHLRRGTAANARARGL